uniref:UPF0033 domain-containing protein n=1 Tax=candidate division WOR-3 bacterium TaxID=2052148 RepID=A0A7C4Y5G4_UNCW3
MEVKKTIDASGLSCPLPIVKLSQGIKEIGIGEVIEIIATDQSFIPDVEAWCRKTGNTLLEIKNEEEKIRAFIKKEK